VTTGLLCQHCGAPWQPDVTGACRFCRIVAPPAGGTADGGMAGGGTAGVAGAGRSIDPDVLARRLLALTSDTAHPLDRLARALHAVAGDRVSSAGNPVSELSLALDDWRYQARLDHGDVAAVAVHQVRGVVLKHQPLPFDEWVVCAAAHLAEFAGTHRHVYDAIVHLEEAR
jgi:hypothetical protein